MPIRASQPVRITRKAPPPIPPTGTDCFGLGALLARFYPRPEAVLTNATNAIQAAIRSAKQAVGQWSCFGNKILHCLQNHSNIVFP